MKLFMETTKIEASRTVGEIQELLGRYGCSGVATMYDQGEVKAVCFQIMFLNKNVAFKLPCRWEAIYNAMLNKTKRPRKGKIESLEAQAKRVAWRQILRWVEAQLALVETEMVKIQEVFLPYVQMDDGNTTLYQSIENKGFKMIGHSKDSQ